MRSMRGLSLASKVTAAAASFCTRCRVPQANLDCLSALKPERKGGHAEDRVFAEERGEGLGVVALKCVDVFLEQLRVAVVQSTSCLGSNFAFVLQCCSSALAETKYRMLPWSRP